ncbi:zf-CCHC domain-containing protein [Tanacetum coccineum]
MVIYNALPGKEYERIFMCNMAKEIWKTLLITNQGNSQVKDNKIDLLVQQYEQFVISEDEYIDSAFARFNTIITSLKALDEGYSSKNYVRKFLRALHPKWRAKVTTIEESKDLTSLSLDELIGNLKVHEMIIKKDSEIVKAKVKRKSIALKAKKESSDEECLTSGSEDEEYAMANGKSDRKCFRCGDPNHLIRECPKPPKDKRQRAFVGGSWSDSDEEDDEKVKDETCLVAHASSEVCSESSYFSDENSSIDDLALDNEYDKLCKMSLKIITKNKRLKATRNSLENELRKLKDKLSILEKNKGVDLDCAKCHALKIENEKLKEESTRLNKFEKSTHCLNEMLSNQKPSGDKLGLGFNSFEASSSGTKEIKFVKAQKKAYSDGGPINMGGPLNDQAAPKIIMGPPPATPGSEKTVSFQKSILGPRPKHIIVNKAKVPVASDNEVKQFYKPLSKPGVGFSKPNFRSKTPPPRRVNNNYSRPKTPQPKRHVGRQNQPHGFPIDLESAWSQTNGSRDSGCSKHMWATEQLSPLTGNTIETSPLVDDDLDEEEAIKVTEKKNLENDIVDETLEIDEIVNIKESRNHPLENYVNEALGDESWIVAMQEELNQFVANDVWELVAQGYNQQEGIDYDGTYAPIARLESIRILLAYGYGLDFKLFEMDVKNAFLIDFINEEVYVAQPLRFIDFKKLDHVYKLKKALYGLKQAPKAWYDRLKAFLIKHEYKMGMVDNTLFNKKKSSNLIIVQIYVDDLDSVHLSDMCDDLQNQQ